MTIIGPSAIIVQRGSAAGNAAAAKTTKATAATAPAGFIATLFWHERDDRGVPAVLRDRPDRRDPLDLITPGLTFRIPGGTSPASGADPPRGRRPERSRAASWRA